MTTCEPDRVVKDSAAKQRISGENGRSKLCIFVEHGVLKCHNTTEYAAVKAGSFVEYGVSKPGLALKYRAVEDNHLIVMLTNIRGVNKTGEICEKILKILYNQE